MTRGARRSCRRAELGPCLPDAAVRVVATANAVNRSYTVRNTPVVRHESLSCFSASRRHAARYRSELDLHTATGAATLPVCREWTRIEPLVASPAHLEETALI